MDGLPNTGGGGGGGTDGGNGIPNSAKNGAGGSGIVLVRFEVTNVFSYRLSVNGADHGGASATQCESLDPALCDPQFSGVTKASDEGKLIFSWDVPEVLDSEEDIVLSALRITDIDALPQQHLGPVSAARLDVASPLSLRFGDTAAECTVPRHGQVRFRNGVLQLCTGELWRRIDEGPAE